MSLQLTDLDVFLADRFFLFFSPQFQSHDFKFIVVFIVLESHPLIQFMLGSLCFPFILVFQLLVAFLVNLSLNEFVSVDCIHFIVHPVGLAHHRIIQMTAGRGFSISTCYKDISVFPFPLSSTLVNGCLEFRFGSSVIADTQQFRAFTIGLNIILSTLPPNIASIQTDFPNNFFARDLVNSQLASSFGIYAFYKRNDKQFAFLLYEFSLKKLNDSRWILRSFVTS